MKLLKLKPSKLNTHSKQESRSSNIGKRLLNKSKSSQALLTGELPEETQFRQDKEALEKETFRLEVHETILKSDREESELALDRIRKSANNTKESLRQ